jgi:N-methylhydantoinase A/oxoprolinase/acetone carboxylase beta subunit
MSTSQLLIGIDTGGTYTDAVVIDAKRHMILATAKAITTKGNLAVGVSEAMAAAIAKVSNFDSSSVAMVSVSTTLATNAVVEGHGSAVGLVLAGFDQKMVERTGLAKSFPNMPLLLVKGGHDHNGNEVEKLDVAALETWLKTTASQVSAFAVASAFAVRNPAHETAIGEMITAQTQLPVTLSTQLASALDAPRRAQTAVLNARLISRISDLVKAVKISMAAQFLDCPLMLVRGDGSLAKADVAALRPIETVLSGPAASLIGAQWISGQDDFIMSDMGGTTTDVGLLIAGRPKIAAQGAEVGGWRTMVSAIDVKTIGLGGDSEVRIELNGKIELGPQRAVPIALIAEKFPQVIELLEADLADNMGGSMHGKFLVLPFGATQGNAIKTLPPREAEILAEISENPIPFRKVATSSAAQRAVANLRKAGLLQYCSFTPSDAAHVLGLQSNWSTQGAVLAAKLLARFIDMKLPDESRIRALSKNIWNVAVANSCHVILDSAFGVPQNNLLIDQVCAGEAKFGHVAISLAPTMPIVAVGGPVKIYYSEVAKRLNCDVIFAPHCDVANAIGAAAGVVAYKVVVQVEGDGNGVFRVTGQGEVLTFASGTEALAAASKRAEERAFAQAIAQGAGSPQVKIHIEKQFLPDAASDDSLLAATITAEARGQVQAV